MRIILPLIILVSILIYLNRAYSHIYSMIGDNHLAPPTEQTIYQFSGEDQAGPKLKIVTLGDSLMAGVGSSRFDTILGYRLADNLKSQASDITLVNLAQPGGTTRDVLQYQLTPAANHQPDNIYILIGVNDIHDFVTPTEFSQNYEKILDSLALQTKAQITVINIPFIGSNLLLYPPYNLYFDIQTQRYNQIIKKLAESKQIRYVDLYTKSKPYFRTTELYSVDQFHPSDEGYKLWGQLINENRDSQH